MDAKEFKIWFSAFQTAIKAFNQTVPTEDQWKMVSEKVDTLSLATSPQYIKPKQLSNQLG